LSPGLVPLSKTAPMTTSAMAGDIPQSAPASHVGIKPQSHEQVTSAVDPSASSPQRNTTVSDVAVSSTQCDPVESAGAILPEELWDRAYDDLKANESKLIMAYEKILSRELDVDAHGSVAFELQTNRIEQTEPTIRRSQMRKLAQAGLQKTDKEAKAKQKIGDAMQVVLSAKETVSSAIEAIPQAALAWTGVCFALQILLNPADESKANRDGIVYVMSRMDWYWSLSKLLFKENITKVDRQSFRELQCELQNRVVDLYKTLLSYQMKSVCSYYRNRQVKREDNREDNQCLQDLRVTNPADDMIRIEGTKGGLLEDSYVWILNHQDFINWRDGEETRLLWIRGDPGKGKTMLLIGVVKELKKSIHDSELLSYFFCQSTDSRLNHATAVLRGLIYQLLMQHRFLISYLREEYDKAGQPLFEDVNAFVPLSRIFAKMLNDARLAKVYLIVDALDECDTGLVPLLDFIVLNMSTPSSQVKWLVSSRNQRNIEERLTIRDSNVELSLELNAESVSGAVAAYIRHKVSKLDERKHYEELRTKITEVLQQKADGTFLWAALVCNELESVATRHVLKVLDKMPSKLKELYSRMMQQIEKLEWDAEDCKSVLSTVTLAYRPLHLEELATLTGLLNDGTLTDVIKECASFLIVRERLVHLVHQSAKDYFMSLEESKQIFPGGHAKGHAVMVSRSLSAMSDILRRDIYGLLDPGFSIEQVESVNPDPLARIRYACAHWIDHICEMDSSLYDKVGLHDNGEIHRFLKEHFLHWLEALSLMRHVTSAVAKIRNLKNLLVRRIDVSQLLDLVQDELRFILHNRWVIENAPLQTYASALIFSPFCSLTREQWKKEEPEWVITKPFVASDWSPCLQTLEGHGGGVTSVVFSHDSRWLASASYDRTVKIWDAETGKCFRTLEGHGEGVTLVVFSHDSR